MKSKQLKVLFWLIPIILFAGSLTIFFLPGNLKNDGPDVVVYKSPTCGCCKKWINHLQDNGFNVKAVNMQNVSLIKKQHGVRPQLASCHTALVNGYTIEGHVPADDIYRLLKEKPEVKGLTVPGMPIGSPGMEQGNRKDPYAVYTFKQNGETTVYSKYP